MPNIRLVRTSLIVLLWWIPAWGQTTVQCQPVTPSCPSGISNCLSPSDNKMVCVVTSVNLARPIADADVAHPATPAINPIVQVADCVTNFGNQCIARFKRKPLIGNRILIFASSFYGNAGLRAPAECIVDLSIVTPTEQLIASKYIASATDAKRDVFIDAKEKSYFKAVVVEVRGLAVIDYLDAVSKLSDQRDTTNYSVMLTTFHANNLVFAMHHSQKHDLTTAEGQGWTVVNKVTDGTYGDTLLLQYKMAAIPQSYTVSGMSKPALAQNVSSVAVAYKLR